MTIRATTLFLSVVIFACGVSPLQAQSLTSEQRAKLDGRLEQVVERAESNTLNSTIDRFKERVQEERSVAARREGRMGLKAASGQRVVEPEAATPPAPSPFQPGNLQPTARTPEGIPVYSVVVHTEASVELARSGVSVTSSFDGFATVRATPTELQSLTRFDEVTQVHTARRLYPTNDEPAAEAGARTLNRGVEGTSYQGEDVTTCVIDSGIDWSHPDFTDENGNSRIRYIWDQADDSTGVSTPVENRPGRFGGNFSPDYGSEYGPSRIQNGNVIQEDTDGHGTHVAGTVASSGRAYEQSSGVKKYRGAAPEADIVAVKTDFTNVGVIDGVNYCRSVAEDEGEPVVVNLSLGTNFAPHDGTSALSLAIESITGGGEESGTVVVASAGNNGGTAPPVHTGPVSLSDSADVTLDVPEYNSGFFPATLNTNLWAYEGGAYSISVYSPGREDTLRVDVSAGSVPDSTLETPGGETIRINSGSPPTSSARFFQVYLIDPAAGTWTARIRAEGTQSTKVHGWIGRSPFPIEGATWSDADRRYTLGAPATSRGVIAVGNYVHRQRWTSSAGASLGTPVGGGFTRDRIAGSSSRGPTVDGRQKPVVAAPGTFTASALSDDAGGATFGADYRVADGEHHLLTGTSMSAPVVSGSVALLLQEDADLSTNAVRDLLEGTARVDDAVTADGGSWNDAFGYGKLNAYGAMTALLQGGAAEDAAAMEILSYEDAFGASSGVGIVPVGEGGANQVALRVSPTISGPMTGVFVSLGPSTENGMANQLTDSLHVEVWVDDGGEVPDTQIGKTVAVPPNRLRAFTPTYVSLSKANIRARAGADYYIVLDPKDGGGSVNLLAETTGGAAGRSLVDDGSGWSGAGNDLVIRAQVGGVLAQQATIAEARSAGADETVEVKGTVSRAYGGYVRIQDESGTTGASGLVLRQTGGPYSEDFQDDIEEGVLQPGTQVQVTGTLSSYAGQLQISNLDLARYSVLSQGAPPEPQSVTLQTIQEEGEAYEGELVQVEGVSMQEPSDASFQAGTGYTVEGPNGGAVPLRIQQENETMLPGIPLPETTFRYVGVVGQFNNFSGNDEGYQLIPMRQSDLRPAVVQPPSDREGLAAGGAPIEVELSTVFTDPFGEGLSFTAEASNEIVASPSVDGAGLEVRPDGQGTTQVTVAAETNAGGASATQFGVEVTQVQASVQRTFGGVGEADNYRLVALPGAVDRSLAETVEGDQGTDWQAYWDDGSEENYMVQFDASEPFRFAPGNGFWLSSAQEWTSDVQVDAAAISEEGIATVDLHDGWNIVSNPLATDVAFEDIQAAHDASLQGLFAFDGGFGVADTMRSARSGRAYYFLNDQDLEHLRIPRSTMDRETEQKDGKEARRFALSAQLTDREGGASTIEVGITKNKEAGHLERLFAPPGRFSPVSLRIKGDDRTSSDRARLLMVEERPKVREAEGQTFDLRLSSREGKAVQLLASNLEAMEGREVRLLNRTSGRSYDLRSQKKVTVQPSGETASLTLAVGSATYVDQQAKKVRPEEVTLTSYPNPIHQKGTLSFALPETQEVRLVVYDVLGRQVRTLVRGRKTAGRHTVQLDTGQLASGIYFGRLEAGGQRLTQKITIVR